MRLLRAARMGSLTLIAALFALLLFFADLDKIGRAFVGIRWEWALWVPVLNLVNTLVEALRLAVILFPLTGRFRVRSAFNSSLVGIVGNIMLPLRFGDGARAYYVAKTEKIGLSCSLSALTLDRIADFLLFFALMAVTAIFNPFPPSVAELGLTAAGIFAVAIASIFVLTQLGGRIATESAGKLRRRIAEEVRHFESGLAVMRNTGLLFPILFFSALSWILRAAMIWAMFEAFTLDLPLMATSVTLILLNFGIAVVSTPANLGGFELATVGALKLFSVEMEVGLGYALALHVIEVAPMLAFGMLFLWFEGFKAAEVLRQAKDMPREDRMEAPGADNTPVFPDLHGSGFP